MNGTYHGDCMGTTPDIGQEMKDDNMECICPSCTSDTTLVSSTSVDPPTSSVVNPCEPCVDFQWGDKEMVKLFARHSSFLLPSGKAGKDFVLELARLYQVYADNTTLHSIALTACCVFQMLLLQKLHARSKSKDHVHCLESHLELWLSSDIDTLVKEGKCIQDHLQSTIHSGRWSNNVVRKFDQLMTWVRLLLPLNFSQ